MEKEIKLTDEQQKVFDFLKPRGENGATATQIAEHLGLSLEGETRKKSLSKVRRVTRAVIKHYDGKRETNGEGREKVYSVTV